MIRLIIAAAFCVFASGLTAKVVAAPVSESTVEKACGDKIEGGCTGQECAMGCEKEENGKLYTYGCIFPDKAGKTKAKCSKLPAKFKRPPSSTTGVGGDSPVLKAE